MLVKEIKLENFRSYDFLEMPINKGITLVHGDNGSGKSSIIESIMYAFSGKSFRTNETDTLIRKNFNYFQVLVGFDDGQILKVTKKANERAKIVQNKNKKTENYASLVKKFPTCMVENKEFFFTYTNPEGKRQYLNKLLFYVEQQEQKLINELKKIITQRAACLKNKDYNQITYWDQQLINIEPNITKTNKDLCELINDYIRNDELIHHFAEKNEWIRKIRLIYSPGYEKEASFSEILAKNIEKDMILKRTSEGPHRRSFKIDLDNCDASEILSRGQQKIASIILHLLQRQIIVDKTNQTPLLLMDDISSELDKENSNLMLKYLIDNRVQSIMTSIDQAHFTNPDNVLMFHVEHNGEVSYVK